jgi:integrase
MEEELSGAGEWDEGLYVAGDAVTGAFGNPEVLGREWAALTAAEGWRGTQGEHVRFHDLRHTFATPAIANKMDVMTVASILGHRDVSTTLNVYAIALEESKRKTMDAVDGILSAPKPKEQIDPHRALEGFRTGRMPKKT